MSDSPRTDAAHKHYRYRSRASGLIYEQIGAAGDCDALVYVSGDFARTLERELSAANAEVERLRREVEEERKHSAESDRESCQLQDALGCPCEIDNAQEKAMERIRDLVAAEGELGDLRNERDTLAARVAELAGLLSIAVCPNCDGSGAYLQQSGDEAELIQCQWCYEVNPIKEHAARANTEGK